jgi:hypothetical protein
MYKYIQHYVGYKKSISVSVTSDDVQILYQFFLCGAV